jgi:hypothetical protein
MRNACIVFLLLNLLLTVPNRAQEVFIKGDSEVATQARTDLERLTHYKSSLDASHALLFVDRESWSPDFLSPATVAVTMKLISLRGELLWSKIEPIGSRSEEVVVQDLLKDLAKANPRVGERVKTLSGVGTEAKTSSPRL